MKEFSEQFLQQLITTSYWEWLAVILALAYLLLAMKESLWCWPAAFISTLIYTVLFFDINLYMESLLNIYYLIMAIYGFYQWNNKKLENELRPIIRWPIHIHFIIIVGITLLVLLSGFFLEKYTTQDFAYLDSFTTWFAVITTFMVAKKVLENWFYWLVIDSVSIYLFVQKGLALTALLFFAYIIIVCFGYFKWKARYDKQNYAIV